LLREMLDAMRYDRDAWREQARKEGDELALVDEDGRRPQRQAVAGHWTADRFGAKFGA
jgi:hypothetical protein